MQILVSGFKIEYSKEFICKVFSVFYCRRDIHFSSISSKGRIRRIKCEVQHKVSGLCLRKDFLILLLVTGTNTLLIFHVLPLGAECQAVITLFVDWLADSTK